jgi:hypothetical protein
MAMTLPNGHCDCIITARHMLASTMTLWAGHGGSGSDNPTISRPVVQYASGLGYPVPSIQRYSSRGLEWGCIVVRCCVNVHCRIVLSSAQSGTVLCMCDGGRTRPMVTLARRWLVFPCASAVFRVGAFFRAFSYRRCMHVGLFSASGKEG